MSSSVLARVSRRALTLLWEHPERSLIGGGVLLVLADSALTDPAPYIPSAPPEARPVATAQRSAPVQQVRRSAADEAEEKRDERVGAEQERAEREEPDHRPAAPTRVITAAPRIETTARARTDASPPAAVLEAAAPAQPARAERSTTVFASVPFALSTSLPDTDHAPPSSTSDAPSRTVAGRAPPAAPPEPTGIAALIAAAPAPLAAFASELLGAPVVQAAAEHDVPEREPLELPKNPPRGANFPPLKQPGGPAGPDGLVATFSLDSPAEGSVYLSSFHEVRAANWAGEGPITCRLESLLSVDSNFGDCAPGDSCGRPGYAKSTLQGTAAAPGQQPPHAWQSVSGVLPLRKGVNTYYLLGRSDCRDAVWGAITLRAVRVQ
jgi:hypothetical protein